MSVSEIKGNEVEGSKAPPHETRSPSEKDKEKIQPTEKGEISSKHPPKESGDGNHSRKSDHPKLHANETEEKTTQNTEGGKKASEHPKLENNEAGNAEKSNNNDVKATNKAKEAEKTDGNDQKAAHKPKEAEKTDDNDHKAAHKAKEAEKTDDKESDGVTKQDVDPDYKSRYDRTPKNNGEWVNEDGSAGQRGESTFVPDDPDVQQTLKDNGVDGIKYNDCYPDLSPVSKFDAYLDPEDYELPDKDQFQMCNDSLAEAVLPDPDTGEIENPELAAQFTPDQLADIEAGETPYGYTWHHDVEAGHMQLVPTNVHQACRHSGGRSVWGGGADCR